MVHQQRQRGERVEPPPVHVPEPLWNEKLILVWGWLALYLLLFYLSPLSSGGLKEEGARRLQLWALLMVPDQLVPHWYEGATWHSLGQRADIAALAGAIFAVACSAGWLCLKLARLDRLLTRWECFVFSAAVGLNLVSLVTLALGLVGLLDARVFITVGIGVIVGALAVAWQRRNDQRPTPAERESLVPAGDAPKENSPGPAAFTLNRNWLWLGLPFVLAIVLGGMLPPVDFDVREYHLQAPKEFFQAGRITFLPHNVYANMPLGAEMLALAAMVICGDWWLGALAGKTLIACFAPLTALALVAAGRRFVSPAAGVVAALVYISIPWVALVSMHGLIEGAFAFYLLMGVYAVLLLRRRRSEGWSDDGLAGLAGFLAGGAVSCKYPAALYCVVPLAAWIALDRWRPAPRAARSHGAVSQSIVRPLAMFVLLTTLGCGLWLAKNAVLTGNPVYPLLFRIFDGATRTPDKEVQWAGAHSPPNYSFDDLATRMADATVSSDWLSPLLVSLAALALLGASRRSLAWPLGIYVGFVFLAWWFLTHRIDRFLVPVLPLVALATGIGATWSTLKLWRATLAGLLALGLLFNFLVITSGLLGENRYLEDINCLRDDPVVSDLWHTYLNERADEVTGALLVGDAQPFDLRVPVQYNTVFDDCIFEQLARGRTSQQVHEALKERGISHVYVAWHEIQRYRSPGNYGITDFLESRVFRDLVADGVFEEVPHKDGDTGRLYRVAPD